jgi:hypothetical protein
LADYCLALDENRIEDCVQLFTAGGSFEVYGRSFAGHEGLEQMMMSAPPGLHLGGHPSVSMLDPDRARTKQNLLFLDRENGEARRAVYTDDLARTGQGWRFAKRRCQFIVSGGLSDRPDRPVT